MSRRQKNVIAGFFCIWELDWNVKYIIIWRNFQEEPRPPFEFLWISNHSLSRFLREVSHQKVWTGLLSWSLDKLIDPVQWLDLINFLSSHVWKYVTFTAKFSNLLKKFYQDCTIKVLKHSCRYSLYFSTETIIHCPAAHSTVWFTDTPF